MCLGVFPIELVAMNFTDANECADKTEPIVSESHNHNHNHNQLDTEKCKYMLFLIGIIKQKGWQFRIFKINILYKNSEFERRTTSVAQ